MADVNSADIMMASGGGGYFKLTAPPVTGQSIASGQTGDLVTIGTAGKITRITYLAGLQVVPDISITRDGVLVLDAESIARSDFTGQTGVYIGLNIGSPSRLREIYGEFLTISKGDGNTVDDIIYSYETGEITQ